MQRHECNVAQTLRELFGSPLALGNSVIPLLPNPVVSDPFIFVPSIPPIQPQPISTIANFPCEEKFDLEVVDSELRFQQEFALVSMKYR